MSHRKGQQASLKPHSQQKTKRLTPCPANLERFLEVINLLPFHVELPSIRQVQGSTRKERSRAWWLVGHEEAMDLQSQFISLCRVILNLGDESFGQYIFGSRKALQAWAFAPKKRPRNPAEIRGDEMYLAIARYNELRFQRAFLRSLLALASSRQKEKKSRHLEGRLFGSWYINEDDGFEVSLAPFIKALWDDKVFVSRIKICANKNCRRVFWAGREDQKCCPLPPAKLSGCANAYRNQQYRDEQKKLAAKLQRIANQEYKERLVARRECVRQAKETI